MGVISISELFRGGISESDFLSKYRKNLNSVSKIVGFDIHQQPGSLVVNQALTMESPTSGANQIDETVSKMVVCSNGKTYMFGKISGKVWSRNSGGTYTLEATVSPATGAHGILDAYEFNGYLYYTMQYRLGRWPITSGSWAARDDNFATFLLGNSNYHPIKLVTDTIYIGDSYYIAQVDDTGTFVGNALDLPTQYNVKCLEQDRTDLLIGTYVINGVSKAKYFRWDTWSVSFFGEDEVEDIAINSFIPSDNVQFANIGEAGQIYGVNSTVLEQYKKIPGTYTNNDKVTVYANAVTFYKDIPLFGLSQISGDATLLGIYSLGNKIPGLPKVLSLEYVISTGYTAHIRITALAVANGILLCAWEDDNTGSTTYGVDAIDFTTKFAGAYIETGILQLSTELDNFKKYYVNYNELPDGTSISIAYNKLNSEGLQPISGENLVSDSDRQQVFGELDISSRRLKIRIIANSVDNSSPHLEDILVVTK